VGEARRWKWSEACTGRIRKVGKSSLSISVNGYGQSCGVLLDAALCSLKQQVTQSSLLQLHPKMGNSKSNECEQGKTHPHQQRLAWTDNYPYSSGLAPRAMSPPAPDSTTALRARGVAIMKHDPMSSLDVCP
jgi:hypothetical protein